MTKTNQLFNFNADVRSVGLYSYSIFVSIFVIIAIFNKVFLEGQPVDEYIQSLLKRNSTYASIVSRTRNENHLYWRRHANFIISETVRCATKKGFANS